MTVATKASVTSWISETVDRIALPARTVTPVIVSVVDRSSPATIGR